jgi:phosphoglycolate phosphatase-like HAD superfamily hydrolase
MSTLLLFDIDGTLITTGGAGYRAMKRAVELTLGVERALDGIPVAGRTDSIILRDAVHAVDGRVLSNELRERIREVYCDLLQKELDLVGGGPGVLPGVRELLARLADRREYHVALLTGNFSQSAQIKLGYYDLWHFFAWGAFGEDAVDRNDLLPVALSRYRERTGLPIAPSDVVIIGDTPNDVEVARAGQARAVCVTTGQYDRAALLEAGADVVFHDLSDTEEVIRVFQGE